MRNQVRYNHLLADIPDPGKGINPFLLPSAIAWIAEQTVSYSLFDTEITAERNSNLMQEDQWVINRKRHDCPSNYIASDT